MGWEFERREGDKVTVQIKPSSEVQELTIEFKELTASKCKLNIEPSPAIKRIFTVIEEAPTDPEPKKTEAPKEPDKAPAVATPPKVGTK